MPDNAVITTAMLKIRKQGWSGTDPFTILGALRVDTRKPYFGTSSRIGGRDFQAAPQRTIVATFHTTPVNNWYTAVIKSLAYPYINKTGTTQFRLYFTTDDNNDNWRRLHQVLQRQLRHRRRQTDADHHILHPVACFPLPKFE